MFELAVNHVLAVEGGYVNDERDPGGETNFGISKRSYPDLDIAALTREQAIEIYHRDFWLPLGAEGLEARLALLAFDAAVNHGLGRAQRWLRDHPTFGSFLAHRLRFYARLSTFTTFGRGWVNRMATVVEAATEVGPGPRRIGEFDTVVFHHPSLGDRLAFPFARRPTLRGRFLSSRTEQSDLPKLDVKRVPPRREPP